MAANEMGIITRIALKNFVTYDEVVIKPGKNLNLIIGPNGTGKSTIVSAIVLGLGGSPKVIGRASQIGGYVQGGKTDASIEIDLQHGPDKVVTIKREFNIRNNTHWFINGKASNPKLIKDLMEQFNIQVDNLCQFLPQDKVQEFSNLTAQELLVETERSVGDPRLSEHHAKLKELRVQQAALENQLESNSRLITKETQTCDVLKDKVGHIKEQKTIEKKLKVLRQKKAWVIYQEKREEFNKAKAERDEAKKVRDKLEKKLKPIQLEIAKLKNTIQSLDMTAKQKSSYSSTQAAKLVNLQDGIEVDETKIDDDEKECQQAIRAEQETDQRIAGYMEQKNKLENDLKHKINEVGSVEAIQGKLASITETVNQHKQIMKKLTAQQTFLVEKAQHCMRKMSVEEQNLAQIQNIESQRIDLLQKLSKDAYTGVMWLRSHMHLFSSKIHEPMILLINLTDPSYAKYFENVISPRDLTAFVCEDKSDMNKLLSYLRDQQRLTVNAVHSDPNRNVDDRPSIPLQQLERFGFQHYMSSLIDAPRTVLNYLISNYNLHQIPIGNDNILNHLDELPALKLFFSSNKSYSIRHSRYTGEKITTETAISSRDLLSTTLDSETINRIQNELSRLEEEQQSYQSQIESLNEKIKQEETKANSQKNIRTKLEMDSDKIKDLERRIRMNDTRLKDTQSKRKSVEQIRAEFKAKIEESILKQLGKYKNYNKCLDEYYKSFIISEEMKLQVKLEKNQLMVKENDSHEIREEYENAERNLRNLENEMKPLRQELENVYEEAKKLTDGISYTDENFKSFQDAFSKLPSSLEEIISEIQKTQAKAFNVNDRNEAQRILYQFETAKKHLERLTEDTTVKEQELIKITEEIEAVKKEWLPMLNSLVEKINKNFSSCFSKMKCAGEVSLIDGGSPMDFAKYGLRIKVKFRDADELQALSRNHQSGGERAVTTAAYMISLQELTRVPFRCVDEINQGMDATNERRVFELIVNITSTTNSAQYFLLTPKLLPDLKYNESMTVLTVYNGKHMASSSKFDIQDNIDRICNVVRNRRRAER